MKLFECADSSESSLASLVTSNLHNVYEPRHEMSNNVVCATSKA